MAWVERQFFGIAVPSARLVAMAFSHRVVLLLALFLRISGGLRRRPQRALLKVTRGGADADEDEPRPQALSALGVPRGGAADDEDEPYDDVDDEPDDDDDDEARAAKAAQRWTRRAFEAAQRGRPRAAAHAFEKALELTPDDAPYRAALLINAGSYLAFSGRSADALGPLKEAARLAPDDARALHALGNALHQCDAAGDALEVYARALHAAPSPDFPPNAPLLNNVATILLARGERSLARDRSPRASNMVATLFSSGAFGGKSGDGAACNARA